MPVVLFNCPKTKLPVPTGVSMDEQGWNALRAGNNKEFNCPLCKQVHVWNKDTGYLAGKMAKK